MMPHQNPEDHVPYGPWDTTLLAAERSFLNNQRISSTEIKSAALYFERKFIPLFQAICSRCGSSSQQQVLSFTQAEKTLIEIRRSVESAVLSHARPPSSVPGVSMNDGELLTALAFADLRAAVVLKNLELDYLSHDNLQTEQRLNALTHNG